MRVVGLFAGVGGIEEGLRRAGHEITMLCENDEAAAAVLAERFPDAELRGDVVSEVDKLPRGTDVLSAGFPCQDLSQAGRTAGIAGTRSGVVRRVFDLLRTRRVPWVVLENVPNMLRLQSGCAMELVVSELEALGYRWAYRVLDTNGFGLAQRRKRVFLLASLERDPAPLLLATSYDAERPARAMAATRFGFYWTEGNRGAGWAAEATPPLKGGSGVGIPSPPAVWNVAAETDRAFVTPSIEDAESLQGFERGWTESSKRPVSPGVRWRMVGNAVSVPIAEWLGTLMVGAVADTFVRCQPAKSGRWPEAATGGPGREKVGVAASHFPLTVRRVALGRFLRTPAPLSPKAAAGFLDRVESSSLRIVPPACRIALAAYCTARGVPRIARRAQKELAAFDRGVA